MGPFSSSIRRPKTKCAAPKRKKSTSAAKKAATAVALVSVGIPSCQSLASSPHFPPNSLPRTSSFAALWAGDFPTLADQNIKVHTLILGTHPSIKSLEEEQYFGHPMNAFWWIVGDCLKFRRASGMKKSGKEPFGFVSEVRYEEIIPYSQQTELFCSKGFALWDVVGECERKGSLDQDIKKEVANDIRGFCQQHPNIRQIVLANGGTGSTMFLRHFRQWWLEGALKAGENKQSQTAFGKVDKRVKEHVDCPIKCISAISVSPAAAKYTYKTKRDFWDEAVFCPGLQFHKELQQTVNSPRGVNDVRSSLEL